VDFVRALIFSLVAAAAALTAGPAYARQQPSPQQPDPSEPIRVFTQRPYRGVFGGGYSETEQLLTLGLNMGGGFDSSVFVDNRPNTTPTVPTVPTTPTPPTTPVTPVSPVSRDESGFVSGSANLSYRLNRESLSFSAGAGGAYSYYPGINEPGARRYYADAGASWLMSTRTALSGGFAVSYQPMYHLSPLPGVVDPNLGPGNPFDATIGSHAETYRNENADVRLGYAINKRIGTSFGYGMWRLVSPDGDRDSASHGASARVSFGLTRGLGFHTSYQFTSSRFDGPAAVPPVAVSRYTNHNVDFGLYFGRALSLTRKTTMTFATGTSTVTDGNSTHFGLVGNVRLGYELARTWSLSAWYARDVQFVQAFLQPVSTDTASVQFGGLISRRLRFDAENGYAFGRVGFGTRNNDYRALSVSSGLGMAINRHLNAGVRYLYTRYHFGSAVDVPLDMTFQTNRHAVNAYLSSWLPLFSRTRRP
jgi:hypothetical protein